MTAAVRAGRILCWTSGGMAAFFFLWLLGGTAIGLFERPDLRYWPFLFGIPLALGLGLLMPATGLVGSVLAWRQPRRVRVAGAVGVAWAAVLWLLVLTSPPPGI